jgi:hypothetical protein
MKHRSVYALLLLVTLAFVLRCYDLDGQSMWSDEGLSVFRARQSLRGILTNVITVDRVETRDTNPPFYFLLLHLWRAVAGESVFALRFLSVMAGVLSVPMIYTLGRCAFGVQVGLGAALLMVISPFHIWQCQEMRNYSLLLLLNLASVYGLFRFTLTHAGRGRWRWLVLWGVAGLAGVYTHYFGFFVLAFGVLGLVLVSLRQRLWGIWLGLGIAGLAMLPALPAAFSRFLAGQQVDFVHVPVGHLLSHAASVYSVGIIPTVVQPSWRVLPVVALATVGTFASLLGKPFSEKCLAAGLLLGYQVIPLAILIALSAITPLYNGPRHLLFGLPPFLVFIAAGSLLLKNHWRSVGIALGMGIVVSQVAWLKTQFTAPYLVKDDVRGAAQYLNAVTCPDDMVVLHDTLIGFTFDYYYTGDAPWVAIPSYGEIRLEASTTALERTGASARRVWFLTGPTPRNGHPRRALIDWADEHWPHLSTHSFPSLWLGVKLDAYLPHGPMVESLPDSVARLDVTWGNDLLLQGYEAAGKVASGGIWQPVFYWSKLRPEADEYVLSLRLTDDQGKIWAQSNEALWKLFPPAAWPMEATIQHEHEVELTAGLPPGEYQVWLRILGAENDQPLPASSGGVDVLLTSDLVVKSAAKSTDETLLPPHTTRSARLGREIELLGYYIREGHHRPGHLLYLDLYWRAKRTPAVDYRLRVQLVDGIGQTIGETITTPTRADYPPSRWQPGELLYGKVELLIPSEAKAGFHQINISLVHPETGELLPVYTGWLPFGREMLTLKEVQVVEWPMVTEIPPMQTPLRADLGDPILIELHGYDLSATHGSAGEHLTLTLFWRAQARIETSYTAFVHLAGADEQMAGQGDDVPDRGLRLTTSWREGEVIADEHVIPIRPDAAAGTYRLWVGLYDPETDQRLPAFVDGERQPDDRVLLSVVQVVP